MKITARSIILALWLCLLIFSVLALREAYLINIDVHVADQNIWDSRRFIAFLFVCGFFLAGAVFSFSRIIRDGNLLAQHTPLKIPSLLAAMAVAVLVTLPGLVRWVIPLPEKVLVGYWMEFFLVYCAALLGARLLYTNKDPWRLLLTVAALIMLAGAAHSITYRMLSVTNYPFPLSWSEGNRMFDYSTMLGGFRYIVPPDGRIKAFITWGMQVPWALPFLFPGLTIGAFRFWYHLMWILPSMALGVVAALKIRAGQDRFRFILVAAVWAFLFLEQGPIYTPLILAAILTLLAVRSRLVPGLILIIAASYYAGSSRWTWTYAPGLWAGLLALLDSTSPSINREGLKNLLKPAALGMAGYFGGQVLRGLARLLRSPSASGIALLPDVASKTSRQPLLWQRLWPNPTFSPGIVLALLWAILPLVVFLVYIIARKHWKLNGLQLLGLAAVNLAFLVVGIIASVKIGGGSNLHNLDMFLVSLLLVAAQALTALFDHNPGWLTKPALAVMAALILAAPASYALSGGERLELPDREITQSALKIVQDKVKRYSRKGEILFIDHRQLLTFGLVENVPLVDEYEKKVLMDDAMTDDTEYFRKFHADLRSQRFALIVNEPATVVFRGSEHIFGEENDAYVRWVTIPLLCSYEPIYTQRDVNLELLVPRADPLDDLACEKYNLTP